jgi:Family of unknown function (DUF5683)
VEAAEVQAVVDSARFGSGLKAEAAADSLGHPATPRFGRTGRAPADSMASARRIPTLAEPRWVMLHSLVVPGWGQAINGSWLKAGVIGGGEIALGAAMLADARAVRRLDRDVVAARLAGDRGAENQLVSDYNNRLARLTSREWLLGGLVVYSLVDAYVDAQFKNFKLEFQRDPALPGGAPASSGARLSLRWTY